MPGEFSAHSPRVSPPLVDHPVPSRPGSSRTLQQTQQQIYEYLLSIVKSWMPADVLAEFKRLFICHANASSSEVQSCLYEIVFFNYQQEFRYTLKRSCYILINNWDVRRNRDLIRQLIGLFSDPVLDRPTISPTLTRMRRWLREFASSKDFEELKLYAERFDHHKQHWTHHFASYLLASQFANPDNSIDQRQAARRLSRQLREQFKFDLARYTALSQCSTAPARRLRNPTTLGDRVLLLVKRLVLRRSFFSYPHIARIFLSQTQNLTFRAFKPCLLGYLTFGIDRSEFVQTLHESLSDRLLLLYPNRDDQIINDALLLRTSKRLIDHLLTETGKKPSPLFIVLLSQGNAMLLVIVLLKVVLLCRYVRVHLETRIAEIVRYYEHCPEADCRWVIDFLEILHITLTVYTENVQYTLVNMEGNLDDPQAGSAVQSATSSDLETCRIFSQRRSVQAQLQSRRSGFSQVALPPAKISSPAIAPPRIAPDLPAEVLSGRTDSPVAQSGAMHPEITPGLAAFPDDPAPEKPDPLESRQLAR